ncbi:unnamed protein product, partial [Polarella glacialis]
EMVAEQTECTQEEEEEEEPSVVSLSKFGQGASRRAPPSICSAPAAMLNFLAGASADTRKSGDCLPPETRLWVQGYPEPRHVA